MTGLLNLLSSVNREFLRCAFRYILLALFTATVEMGAWFFFGNMAQNGATSLALGASALLLVVFGALLGLCMLLLPWWGICATVLVGTAPFFAFFRAPVFGPIFLVLLAVATLLPYMRVQHERRSRIGFQGWILLRKGLPLFFTLLALFFAGNISSDSKTLAITDIVPKTLIERGLGFLDKRPENEDENALPLPSPNETLDEFIARTFKRTGGVPIDELSYQDRLLVVSGARDEISRNLGIPLSGKERRSDIIFRLIEHRVSAGGVRGQLLVQLVFVFGIFALLRFFFFPLVWLSVGLFYIILWLGKRLGLLSFQNLPVLTKQLHFTPLPERQ